MICPKCSKGKLDVTDTRVGADGSIKRKRLCLACAEMFITKETVVGKYEPRTPKPKPPKRKPLAKKRQPPRATKKDSGRSAREESIDYEETDFGIREDIRESGIDIYRDWND